MNRKDLVLRVVSVVLMVLYTVLTVGPLIWLAYTSFKPNADIVRNIFSLPRSFFLDNYTRAWELGQLGTALMNSFLYSISATLITTLLAMMAGYGFSRLGFSRLSSALYYFFILGLLITVHSVLVPLFILETTVGIDDTRLGVLLPYIAFGLPFLLYLAIGYIKSIPASVEEACIIDGASYFRIFFHIILPMSTPVVITMLIYSFLSNWNEFIFVAVLTSKSALRSLPVSINAFAGGMARDFGLLFAALMISTLPMILFYAMFRKQISLGFAGGALKE